MKVAEESVRVHKKSLTEDQKDAKTMVNDTGKRVNEDSG